MPLDEVEGAVDDVERAESEEIDFEEAGLLDVLLVPLDDGAAGHGGVLDGHEVAHRLVAEEEASRMDREMARHILDFLRQF